MIINDVIEGKEYMKAYYDDDIFNQHVITLSNVIGKVFEKKLSIQYDI